MPLYDLVKFHLNFDLSNIHVLHYFHYNSNLMQ